MENQNQQTQTPQTPNQTPSPINTSSGSKVVPIILGVAVVAVIAIGAYVLGTKQTQPVIQNSVQTTPIPSPTPINETANWKTYKNERLGLLFKYPENHFPYLSKEAEIDDELALFISPATKEEDLKLTDTWILVRAKKYPVDMSLDEYLENKDYYKDAKKDSIEIDGNQGYKITKYPNSITHEYAFLYIGLVSKGRYIYSIEFGAFSKEILIANNTLLNQIFSTFKFINSEEQKIIESVSKDLISTDTPGFKIEVKKVLGNYAYGVAGVSPQGFVWYAVKQNNQWKKIWDGQNDPPCSIINTYNVPKEIYKDCSDNY